MKPVLVLQHQTQDHAATLARWLGERQIPFEVRNSEAGDPLPATVDGYRALALLGGEMSANDDWPPLRREEVLILDAIARDVPVIGHCLGGQLMSRALGGAVGRSPAPEIGWQSVRVHDHAVANDWFGGLREPLVYQWHYEAFTLPRGAVALAGSAACPVQAFAIGRHLAMQFHVELDAEKLGRWSASQDPGYLATQRQHPRTVQTGERMRADGVAALPAQQALADRLYRRWLGLEPPAAAG